MSEVYRLAAFRVDRETSIKYSKFLTLKGLLKGVSDSIEMEADYISIRRVVR